MKILKLRFQNLNSLVGEWLIDFSIPAYAEQGIFAIVGPTGAGKSTILDAICLALYGRTPRLEKINASQNEIMSRQKGECFAMLEFSTKGGLYRCLWSQARARKKSAGNLQNAQHVIEDLTEHKTIENQLRAVAGKVTEITGMDFDHFTRAMLLAQGCFAKFLQSPADERSPILEQITGTEVYTKISKKSHEHKTIEEDKLKNIVMQIAAIKILSSDEVETLVLQLENLGSELHLAIQAKINSEQQLAWLNELDKLTAELSIVNHQQQQLQTDKLAFAPQNGCLKRAILAQELNSEVYINLNNLRQNIAKLKHGLTNEQQQLPLLVLAKSRSENILFAASKQFVDYKLSYTVNLKILQLVRGLDIKISAKNQQVALLKAELSQEQGVSLRLKISEQELQKNMASKQAEQQLIQTYLDQHSVDADLLDKFSGLDNQLDSLQALHQRSGELNSSITKEQLNFLNLSNALEQSQQQHDFVNIEHQTIKKGLDNLVAKRLALANGLTLLEVTKQIAETKTKQAQLVILSDLLRHSQNQQFELQGLRLRISNEEELLAVNLPVIASAKEHLEHLSDLIQSLTAQQLLASKVVSLSEERNKLLDNTPCPLCGSLEHPYLLNLPSINNQLEQKLSEAAKSKQQLQGRVDQLNIEITRENTLIGQITSEYARLQTETAVQKNKVSALVDELKLVNDLQLAQILPASIEQLANKIALLEQLDYKLQQLESSLTKLQYADQVKQIEFTELSKALITQEGAKQSCQDVLQRIIAEAADAEQKVLELRKILDNQLAPFQLVNQLEIDHLELIKQELTSRRADWIFHKQANEELKQLVVTVWHNIEQNTLLQNASQAVFSKYQAELADLSAAVNSLDRERYQIFANKNADVEERLWITELSKYEQQTKSAESELNRLEHQLSASTKLIANLSAQLNTLQLDLAKEEQVFVAKLASSGFSNEADFCASLLTKDKLIEMQQQAEQLTKRDIELTSNRQLLTEKIQRQQSKDLTRQSAVAIQIQLNQHHAVIEAYNQQIGAFKKQLEINQQSSSSQAAIIAQRDQQQIITQKWQGLHYLIGSADGKKFRNFAQGLTFEMVVSYANRQLQNMSDRYLLIRDVSAPLELNVIDNYQGGQVRTTKNLSGGESFVISLALALGLSKLSSNKVQVDSLFLDEGFATLDEDSLQTALEALANLQQEGKLIGVISHVGALKERINLQIQVEPQNGGVSRISGLGCSRIFS